jgi:hypothetical protein
MSRTTPRAGRVWLSPVRLKVAEGGSVRSIVVATCVVLLAACGSGEPTVSEYAEQVEAHTTELFGTLDELTIEGTFASPTVAEIHAVYRGVAAAFHHLHDGLEDAEPPGDLAELHAAALEMSARLVYAGDAMAQRTEAVQSEAEFGELFTSPEALAVEEARVEIITFCLERQAEFDATADRETFADTPWIPPEMQEVVLVAFGCEL